jgi:hypothetical protein
MRSRIRLICVSASSAMSMKVVRRAAAAHFEVSVSFVVNLARAFRVRGSFGVTPKHAGREGLLFQPPKTWGFAPKSWKQENPNRSTELSRSSQETTIQITQKASQRPDASIAALSGVPRPLRRHLLRRHEPQQDQARWGRRYEEPPRPLDRLRGRRRRPQDPEKRERRFGEPPQRRKPVEAGAPTCASPGPCTPAAPVRSGEAAAPTCAPAASPGPCTPTRPGEAGAAFGEALTPPAPWRSGRPDPRADNRSAARASAAWIVAWTVRAVLVPALASLHRLHGRITSQRGLSGPAQVADARLGCVYEGETPQSQRHRGEATRTIARHGFCP